MEFHLFLVQLFSAVFSKACSICASTPEGAISSHREQQQVLRHKDLLGCMSYGHKSVPNIWTHLNASFGEGSAAAAVLLQSTTQEEFVAGEKMLQRERSLIFYKEKTCISASTLYVCVCDILQACFRISEFLLYSSLKSLLIVVASNGFYISNRFSQMSSIFIVGNVDPKTNLKFSSLICKTRSYSFLITPALQCPRIYMYYMFTKGVFTIYIVSFFSSMVITVGASEL